MAQEFNPLTLKFEGHPHALADGVGGALGFMHASVSANGLLAYGAEPNLSQFSWYDRSGDKLKNVGEAGAYLLMRLSPDGRQMPAAKGGATNRPELWLMDVQRGVGSRLSIPERALHPVWSPDGQALVFRGPDLNIYYRDLHGSGSEQRLTQSANSQDPTDWSRDGRALLYWEAATDTQGDALGSQCRRR